MKLKQIITIGLLATSSLLANTTMCFKENHLSMTTIETVALEGGECSSSKSVNDMKKEGWKVDDIKIESSTKGNNYIYIFKKDNIITAMDEEKLEQRIMQKLEIRKQEELATKKKEIKVRMSKNGKTIYINKCQQCHGEKAEIEAYGTARALNTLSLEDMTLAIRDYHLDEYDRGKAFIMKPYASLLREKDIKNIYSYIQTLKPKKEESTK